MELALTIGQVAKAANVGVETVRYYHRCGLLPVPERVHGGIRQYSRESLQRLIFIRRAQALGFTLDEIRALLQLNDGSTCVTARALAERKLQAVEARLRELQALRTDLHRLIGQCHANDGTGSCPLIATLCASC
ncbi:MerR family transcriptional regulator [Cupriavidus basilensis]|uniref:MerR family transcriptional regulator n=1 Tax=Cupriavidus basilensis TaxID=68895 RepID=UPI00157B66BB|nr:MerR family DNA-binding protein [Cupriavidus basilensis]NUA26693.1 MerR family transcriptional regulator [Cupriavidus basilensis]